MNQQDRQLQEKRNNRKQRKGEWMEEGHESKKRNKKKGSNLLPHSLTHFARPTRLNAFIRSFRLPPLIPRCMDRLTGCSIPRPVYRYFVCTAHETERRDGGSRGGGRRRTRMMMLRSVKAHAAFGISEARTRVLMFGTKSVATVKVRPRRRIGALRKL